MNNDVVFVVFLAITGLGIGLTVAAFRVWLWNRTARGPSHPIYRRAETRYPNKLAPRYANPPHRGHRRRGCGRSPEFAEILTAEVGVVSEHQDHVAENEVPHVLAVSSNGRRHDNTFALVARVMEVHGPCLAGALQVTDGSATTSCDLIREVAQAIDRQSTGKASIVEQAPPPSAGESLDAFSLSLRRTWNGVATSSGNGNMLAVSRVPEASFGD